MSGCQSLLTNMCASTRFPEAIPLRNVKTKTIVKALVKFSLLLDFHGLYNLIKYQILCQDFFQKVTYELDIKQYKSSAYHP